jgi:hypothetical protein
MEMAIWIQNYSCKSDFESGVKLHRVKSRGVGKNQTCVCVGRGEANLFKNGKVEGQTFPCEKWNKKVFSHICCLFNKKIDASAGLKSPFSDTPSYYMSLF